METSWKILTGFNWFVFLVVFVQLIRNWEGPGPHSSMGNGINLYIGEGVIFSSTLLTALLLIVCSAPGKYHMRNLVPLGIGILMFVVLVMTSA
ncbi:MAG: hypothetical protein ACKO0N_17535 [Planctomycetota bacterium]